jgi:iron complex outermembrane receptor protein
MKRLHRRLLLASAALALPHALSPASAQQTPATSQSPSGTGETVNAQAAKEDVVIVTGRKREETILDIPVAVTALSGEDLENEGIETIDELVQTVPGIDFAKVGSPFADQVSVRGAGQGRQINAESATGLYRSGAFIGGGNIGGSTFSRMDLFDVGGVEAYRGPQGASFGRNALGGAVNIVSQRPEFSSDPTGHLSVEFGENDRLESQLVHNVAMSDALALRVGGLYVDQKGGFYTNTFLNKIADTEEAAGARLAVRFVPDDTLDINLVGEYLWEDTPSFVPRAYIEGQDPFTRSYNIDSRFQRREYMTQLTIEKELPIGQLTSMTYYKQRDVSTQDDLDAQNGNNFGAGAPLTNPAGNILRVAVDDFARYGQELRLSSIGDGPLSWVVGGEILKLEDSYKQNFAGYRGALSQANTLVFSESEDWNYALFALLGYDLTDALNLSGELRYSVDDKSIDIDATIGAGVTATRQLYSFNESFDNLSPVITLSYSPNDDWSGYLRYATGFRAGGFNLTPDPIPPEDFSLVYDAETAVNYEAGVKGRTEDGSITGGVAVFFVEGEDVLINDQLTIGVPPNARNVNFVVNGGATENYGVELDLSGRFEVPVIGGSVRMRSSAAWSEGRFTESPTFISAARPSLEGEPIPNTRPWTASLSTTYTLPVGLDVVVSATHSYRGQWGGTDGVNARQVRDDVELHNLRLSIENSSLRLTLAVENLFDEEYITNRGVTTSIRNDPRTWSLQLRYSY